MVSTVVAGLVLVYFNQGAPYYSNGSLCPYSLCWRPLIGGIPNEVRSWFNQVQTNKPPLPLIDPDAITSFPYGVHLKATILLLASTTGNSLIKDRYNVCGHEYKIRKDLQYNYGKLMEIYIKTEL